MDDFKKNTHLYKIKYGLDFKVGRFTKEEISEEQRGGTDALIFVSLLFPENGSYSQNHFSIDGRNEGKDLPDEDLFKFWALLCHSLAKSETLSEDKRLFCEEVFEKHRQSVLIGQYLRENKRSQEN